MKTKKMTTIAVLAITLFIGCQKSDEIPEKTSTTISSEEVSGDFEMDNLVNDISNISEDQFGAQQNLSRSATQFKSILPECAKISRELANGVWTRTIDFGTQGCTLPNGNVIKGKIILSFENNFTAKEQKITQKFENFYHNDKKVQGVQSFIRTLKSTPLLAEIHPVTTLTINLIITLPDNKGFERVGTRVREMIQGDSTIDNWEDNVFLVWGSSSTKFSNNATFDIAVSDSPLLFAAACKLPIPTKGIMTFTKTSADGQTKKEAKLDFGNGICDKLATITIESFTKEIELKK